MDGFGLPGTSNAMSVNVSRCTSNLAIYFRSNQFNLGHRADTLSRQIIQLVNQRR